MYIPWSSLYMLVIRTPKLEHEPSKAGPLKMGLFALGHWIWAFFITWAFWHWAFGCGPFWFSFGPFDTGPFLLGLFRSVLGLLTLGFLIWAFWHWAFWDGPIDSNPRETPWPVLANPYTVRINDLNILNAFFVRYFLVMNGWRCCQLVLFCLER